MRLKPSHNFILGTSIITALTAIVIAASGTPSTLRVKTDANHALLIAGANQTAPITTSTFSNTRLATDADGNLLVTGGGGGGIGSCTPNFVTAINSGSPTCTTAGDSAPTIASQINLGNRATVNTVTTNYVGFLDHGVSTMFAVVLDAPSLTSGWGTSPTIESKSNDATGRVTLGTAPSATTLTMDDGIGDQRVCIAQNETTGVIVKSTSAAGVVTFTGTFAAGNVISWICINHRGA